MGAGNELRIIRVKVDAGDSKGLKDIQSSVAALNGQFKTLSGTINTFQNLFSTIIGASFLGVGISQVTQLADSYGLLNDKLKVLTGTSESASQAFKGIQQLADENKSSIEGVGTVYSRLSQSLSDAGASSEQVLKISDLLIKSFRISGATVAEATAGTIQLSQGLATGALRGQELRSVLESNVVIGELLAKSLGKNRGELIKLGESGKITSEVFIKSLFAAQERLQQQSDTLGITFEQVGLKIQNKLLVAIGELSKDLGLAGKLAQGVDYLIEKLPALAAAFATLAAGLVALNSSSIVSGLVTISNFLTPLRLLVLGVSSAVFLLVDNFEKLGPAIDNALVSLEGSVKVFKAIGLTIADFFTFGLSDTVKEELDKTKKELDLFKKSTSSPVEPDFYLSLKDFSSAISAPKFKKNGEDAAKFKDELAALNKEYNSGKIILEEYYVNLSKLELKRLNKELKEGKINLDQYNQKLEDLSREDTRRLFETGTISLSQFNEAIKQNKLEDLNKKFKEGKITVDEYNRSLIALSDNFNGESALLVGTSDFLTRIGTVSQNVASAITETFGRLEDSLLDFIKTGKFSFREFTLAILEDINRIIIRALIIRPLAQGILGSFGGAGAAGASAGAGAGVGGGAANTLSAGYARGGAFNNGVEFFADGGIVNRTTAFGMSRGRMGVMGEAGPEAIMPLKRGADGSLGIKAEGVGGSNVTVNIINQTGSEVQQQESTGPNGEKVLDVLILNRVKEGFARGDFDRTFQQSYGLRRRGN